MNSVIGTKGFRKSARKLARSLNFTYTKDKGELRSSDVIINWGCSNKSIGELIDNHNLRVFNHPRNVSKASDKLSALFDMEEWGITPPPFKEALREPSEDDYPVYARTRKHTKGQGLWFCANRQQFLSAKSEGADYWIKAITNRRTEYRLHVDPSYGAIHRQMKVYDNERGGRMTNKKDRVRSFDNGWKFATLDTIRNPVYRCGQECVSALGLDFGAVDIIWDEEREMAYPLEVNTAPSLSYEKTIEAYTDYFSDRLNM